MLTVMVLILVLPLAATGVCVRASQRICGLVTVLSGLACLGQVVAVAATAAHRDVGYAGVLRADALSAVFLLATGFLYAAVAIYSVGYLAHGRTSTRYMRRFWTGLNIFAWAMLAAPLMNSLALLWIAIEVTTVISALLVAIEDTGGAAEAAWKYVLIASAGLGLALLATIFLYFAGAQLLGQSYDLAFSQIIPVAGRLPHAPVQLAFVLAVLGYGTKMGLFPVHTWLPDAHSEAPTPVSALLSGALLATCFYAVLRYYQVASSALGPRFPRDVLLVFGVLSLLLAALYLFGQRDIKRMLAYSSVEHMGVLAIGVSFGAPIALAGVLLHVLAHAAAKGNAFMGAGVLVHKFGTKRLAAIRGGLDVLPWSGPLFLLAILALGAMPPFGLFRSEFEIVEGGFASSSTVTTAILIIGVTVAFFGLAATTTQILLVPRTRPVRPPAVPAPALARVRGADGAASPGAPPAGAPEPAPEAASAAAAVPRGEPSAWMVVPVLAGALVLLVLGVHPPADLTGLLARAVRELSGVR